MNKATQKILSNEEVISINQDTLGKQAERKIKNEVWNVFVKPLANVDYAIAILNRSDGVKTFKINFSDLGLNRKYIIRDLWQHQAVGKAKFWKGKVQSHETKIFRLKKV